MKTERPGYISTPERELLKIITVYEPDIEEWIEFQQRKSKDDEEEDETKPMKVIETPVYAFAWHTSNRRGNPNPKMIQ